MISSSVSYLPIRDHIAPIVSSITFFAPISALLPPCTHPLFLLPPCTHPLFLLPPCTHLRSPTPLHPSIISATTLPFPFLHLASYPPPPVPYLKLPHHQTHSREHHDPSVLPILILVTPLRQPTSEGLMPPSALAAGASAPTALSGASPLRLSTHTSNNPTAAQVGRAVTQFVFSMS